MNTTYEYDIETLAKATTELKTIGEDIKKSFKSIVNELAAIEIDGEPKVTINHCVDSINEALKSVETPDVLGDNLNEVTKYIGAQEETINKIFKSWNGNLEAVSNKIIQGIKGIDTTSVLASLNTAPESIATYLSDTTKNITESTIKFADDTNKLIYSFTGKSLNPDINSLSTSSVGTFRSLVNNAGNNTSNVRTYLEGKFNQGRQI